MSRKLNKLDKRINYIQHALKIDQKTGPKREIGEFTELVNLIADQKDDMDSNTIKRSNKTNDALDRKEVKSINDYKEIAVGIDGNNIWNKYTKEQ